MNREKCCPKLKKKMGANELKLHSLKPEIVVLSADAFEIAPFDSEVFYLLIMKYGFV